MAKTATKKTINKVKPAMSAEKMKTKKSVKVIKKLRPVSEETFEMDSSVSSIKEVSRPPFGFIVKLVLIVALGSALYLLAQKYRGLVLAGTVNSSPISRYELNQKMVEKYGKQTLDDIINERILNSELKKNNIVVSDQDVSTEMAKIIKDYGGDEAFKSALTQYGLTEAKAKDSIKQSLGLKKLVEKSYKIDITADKIKKYFDDNKTQFKDKKLEEVSASIKDTLYQQEVYAKTQEWFTGVRKTAKIVTFI